MKSPWPQTNSSDFVPVLNEIKDIEPVPLDLEGLADAQDEDEFIEIGVELLKEATSFVIVSFSILNSTGGWNRNQAAVSGNLVRLYKLVSGVLDQTCQGRGEQAQVFIRLSFEALINSLYLIEFYSDELVEDYIRFSFFHERDLRNRVTKNVESRNGIVLPIEDRILKSIDNAFEKSGITIDSLPKRKPQNWGMRLCTRRPKLWD